MLPFSVKESKLQSCRDNKWMAAYKVVFSSFLIKKKNSKDTIFLTNYNMLLFCYKLKFSQNIQAYTREISNYDYKS